MKTIDLAMGGIMMRSSENTKRKTKGARNTLINRAVHQKVIKMNKMIPVQDLSIQTTMFLK